MVYYILLKHHIHPMPSSPLISYNPQSESTLRSINTIQSSTEAQSFDSLKSMNDKSRKWQRLNLFIVNFSHITSFYSILPMIPYLNMELGLDGIFYSLTFSGYYLTQLFSMACGCTLG